MASRTLHVVMPFLRPDNFKTLLVMLAPLDLQWHLICHEPSSIPAKVLPDWIHVHDCGQVPEKWDACYWKLNWFIDNVPIIDADRYHYLCDDDGLTVAAARVFKKATAPVAVCSIKRGLEPQPHWKRTGLGPRSFTRHGPPRVLKPLIATPDALRNTCWMGMVAVLGGILRQMHFVNYSSGDSYAGNMLWESCSVQYFPNAFVYHNWLEPGRYKRTRMET